jgi:hypothetical protein
VWRRCDWLFGRTWCGPRTSSLTGLLRVLFFAVDAAGLSNMIYAHGQRTTLGQHTNTNRGSAQVSLGTGMAVQQYAML